MTTPALTAQQYAAILGAVQRPFVAPTIITPPQLQPPVVGQYINIIDGEVTGYPTPSTNYVVKVGGVIRTLPYLVQAADAGTPVTLDASYSALGNVVSVPTITTQIPGTFTALTNKQARRIGINLSTSYSYAYGHRHVDWMRRSHGTFTDASTGLQVALKANGAPASSYKVLLSAWVLAQDSGTYNCWMPGTCDSVSSTVGTITNFVYDAGHDITTFTFTVPAGNGPNWTVTNPSSTSDYIRVIPAAFDKFANADDFHPDILGRISAFGATTLRGMDWMLTNGSPDTVWAGSIAAGGNGTIRAKAPSLAELCRLGNTAQCAIHANAPPSAGTDWMTNALAVISANLSYSLFVYLEYSNEPWNPKLANNDPATQAALAIAGSYSGRAGGIVSAARSGGVVTVTLNGPPATSGPFYVSGITNITGGYIDASKSLSVVGNTFTYNESGIDVTGVVSTSNYNSYVHTNLNHYLVKAPTTYGPVSTTGVDPYTMLYRYIVDQTYTWWSLAQSLPDKARYRFVLNEQQGAHDFAMYSYALDRYGNTDFIYQVMMAPYIQALSLSSVTSADDVFNLLNVKLHQQPTILISQANAARTYRKKVGYYEGGPGTPDVHGSTTIAAAVAAANRDDRMRVLLMTLYGYMRDLGQTDVFNYYKDGTSLNFNQTIDNSTWDITEIAANDISGPKAQSLVQWADMSSVAQPYTAALHPEAPYDLTWGSISFPNVCGAYFGSSVQNGSVILPTTANTPDLCVIITPPAAGNYTLSLWIGCSSAGEWVTALVNDVEVAHQAALQQVSGTSAPTAACVTVSVTLNAGLNELRMQFKPATRLGTIGINKVVVG